MEFDKLLDNCQALEKTVSILIKSNSNKQAELTVLQNRVFEESQITLDDLIGLERIQQEKLDALKFKKNELDTEAKQFSEINEKLSDLVTVIQQADRSDEEDNECKNEEIAYTVADTLDQYEQVKAEYSKIAASVERTNEDIEKDSHEIDSLIKLNQEIIVDLHRNDSVLRLSEQQNRYAEQQFDMILNQLPWEPLTSQYIDELRRSSDQRIRNIAETLQLQKSEIEELTESLNFKKTKKFYVLENLYSELNNFVQKREEASMITRFNDA